MTLRLVRGLLRSGRPPRARSANHAAPASPQHWAEGRACTRISQAQTQTRSFHGGQSLRNTNNSPSKLGKLDKFKAYFDIPSQSPPEDFSEGSTVTIHGCISKRRDVSSQLAFVDLVEDDGTRIQFKSAWDTNDSPEHLLHKALKAVPKASAVSLTGVIDTIEQREDGPFFDVTLKGLHLLNPFPSNIVISKGALYPPPLRHLQLKFDQVLRDRLRFRQELTETARAFLASRRFSEVETPILFKSTPEGAREFLVPTRRQGYAYALPQSPQQYKQILMAGGIRQYYQFARCFRDEDLRADRQPEFTQLDLEMSFAKGEDVMNMVESLVKHLYSQVTAKWRVRCNDTDGQRYPSAKGILDVNAQQYPDIEPPNHQGQWSFPRIIYHEAMSLYGSDKPDLRVPNKIQRIEHILPESFTSMITYLKEPIVEACVFRFDGPPHNFVKPTWDALPKPLIKNPDGQPIPIVIDSSKPLSGLSPLGHEAAEKLLAPDAGDAFPHLGGSLQEGDLLVIQARPNKPFSGGSTALGTLRNHIYRKAIEEDLLPFDPSFKFLWVTGFPLFTPTEANASDPGQGGRAGFSSTHHPFTAPLTPEDLDLLETNPLAARADHYDLVVNGVELGGGSRRIHVAAVQEYIFREVLQMTNAGIDHFSHLLEALRAGCPPHAGFAFGWDRLVATLGYTESVRDVIAFPKSKKGDEPVARSPGKVDDEEWGVYHLQYKDKE